MAKRMQINITFGSSDDSEEKKARNCCTIGEKICQSLVGNQDFINNNILVNYDAIPGQIVILIDEDCSLPGITIPFD